ncbi:hypothetical protein ACR79T_21535 [Sphingobacterium spiritivorum]|uniref:hypothetical protein n=1 Tax=Sphingobacterium spiritivorum TaxID=258 RepID=UPI003DA2EE89
MELTENAIKKYTPIFEQEQWLNNQEDREIIAYQEIITEVTTRIESILKNYRPVMNGEIYLSVEDVCKLLQQGYAPSNNNPVEIIIHEFKFIPL